MLTSFISRRSPAASAARRRSRTAAPDRSPLRYAISAQESSKLLFLAGVILSPLLLQRRQQRRVLGEHAVDGADRIGGERVGQSGIIPHQRHHDLAARLESDSRSDVRRDHDLPLHRGLHDRHGVLLEECWFYLQITSITLSRWVYFGESVSLRLCHRFLGKRGASESGRLCPRIPDGRAG